MYRIFLALGSLIGISIAMASLLMPGKNNLQTPIATTPTPPIAAPLPASSPKKTNSVLGPLLPSLSNPPTSLSELSEKEPKPASIRQLPPITTPSTPATAPKRFVAAYSTKLPLKKSVPYVTPKMTPVVVASVTPRRFVTTSSATSSAQRFTSFVNPAPRLMSVPTPFSTLLLQPLATPSSPTLFQQTIPKKAESFPYLSVPLQPIVTPSTESSPNQPKPTPASIVPLQPIVTPSIESSPNQPKPTVAAPTPASIVPLQPIVTPSTESSPNQPKPTVVSPE